MNTHPDELSRLAAAARAADTATRAVRRFPDLAELLKEHPIPLYPPPQRSGIDTKDQRWLTIPCEKTERWPAESMATLLWLPSLSRQARALAERMAFFVEQSNVLCAERIDRYACGRRLYDNDDCIVDMMGIKDTGPKYCLRLWRPRTPISGGESPIQWLEREAAMLAQDWICVVEDDPPPVGWPLKAPGHPEFLGPYYDARTP